MTIYGNECGGAGFLLLKDGNVVIGEYSSPVDIVETYIGEPYTTYVDMGILGSRQAWKAQVRRGDGVIVNEWGTRDTQLGIILTAPTSEPGKWRANWGSANTWNGSVWTPVGAGTDSFTIARYAYTFTPV